MRLIRVTILGAWTLAAFVGWTIGINFGLPLLMQSQIGTPWVPKSWWASDQAEYFMKYGLFGIGTVVVTIGTMILGIHGWLPGTKKGKVLAPGFPVKLQ